MVGLVNTKKEIRPLLQCCPIRLRRLSVLYDSILWMLMGNQLPEFGRIIFMWEDFRLRLCAEISMPLTLLGSGAVYIQYLRLYVGLRMHGAEVNTRFSVIRYCFSEVSVSQPREYLRYFIRSHLCLRINCFPF